MYPFHTAKSIWHPEGGSLNQTIEFRSVFHVSDPSACRLHLHVNSNYALYINDQFVDCGSFSDFPEERFYDTLPLSGCLHPGENTFSLFAYYLGKDSFSVRYYPAEAVWSLTEKEQEIFCSRPGIPVRKETRYLSDVPEISPQLSFSFEYDALVPPEAFLPAIEVPGFVSDLQPRPVSKLRIDPPATSSLLWQGAVQLTGKSFSDPSLVTSSPADLMQTAQRCYYRPLTGITFSEDNLKNDDPGHVLDENGLILDLGREMVGFLLIDIALDAPSSLLIGWGEHLEDGHVRTRIGSRNFAARITLPAGRSRFFYPFKRMALRYLEIFSEIPSVNLHYAGIRPVYYPLSKLNDFRCADHLHQQIYRTSIRTLQGCMHEHYEDCPWREQALYTMDSRNQMLIGYYTFEEFTFAKASLKLISHGLREDGYLELINPGRAPITIPCFTAIYLIQAAEYLHYSQDTEFLMEILPVLRTIAEKFVSKMDETGLLPRETATEYWNFYEWQEGLDGAKVLTSLYYAPMQAFVSLALDSLTNIETTLGFHSEAKRWLSARDKIRQAFHSVFFDPSAGCYRSYSIDASLSHHSELTQALAVCAGLVPENVLESVLEILAGHRDLPFSEPFYPVSLSHSIFKYEALLKKPEKYASYVFEDIAVLYGSMLRKDATTFWETIDGGDAFENAGSLCHGWSAVPAYLYLKYVIDLRQEGCRLPSSITGISGAQVVEIKNPGSRIHYKF